MCSGCRLLPGPTINSQCRIANRISANDFSCLPPAHKGSYFLLTHCDKASALAINVFTPGLFGLYADVSEV